MSETMSRIHAVKAFLERNASKIEAVEFMAFWKACSEEDRAELAQSAAKQLGVELQG